MCDEKEQGGGTINFRNELEDAIEKLEGEIAAATDPKQRAELEAELATKRSWLEVVAAAG